MRWMQNHSTSLERNNLFSQPIPGCVTGYYWNFTPTGTAQRGKLCYFAPVRFMGPFAWLSRLSNNWGSRVVAKGVGYITILTSRSLALVTVRIQQKLGPEAPYLRSPATSSPAGQPHRSHPLALYRLHTFFLRSLTESNLSGAKLLIAVCEALNPAPRSYLSFILPFTFTVWKADWVIFFYLTR